MRKSADGKVELWWMLDGHVFDTGSHVRELRGKEIRQTRGSEREERKQDA
jgi:hypothetical protein